MSMDFCVGVCHLFVYTLSMLKDRQTDRNRQTEAQGVTRQREGRDEGSQTDNEVQQRQSLKGRS